LTKEKSHENVVAKAETKRDYNGMSAGKMSALRKRQCKEERDRHEWQTTIFVLQ
jgi:hypothetical protein